MFGRRALAVTTAATILTGLVFALFPRLDILASDVFEDTTPSFHLREVPWALHLRSLGFVLPLSVCGLFAVFLLWKVVSPRLRLPVDARMVCAVLLTFALAPGLLVNGILKEHWGRPRPVAVMDRVEQGDIAAFYPWWNPTGPCATNCSFVSGEASAAMAMVVATLALPASVAGFAGGIAVAFTACIALLRLAFGGHFLSDLLFAVLFTHLIAIGAVRLMHSPLWPPGRPGVVEGWLAGRGLALRALFRRNAASILRRAFRPL